jgi:hypothetical protein
MATPYSEVFDLFLTSIQDYRINRLYEKSVEDMENYLMSFLIKAIVNFRKCKTDLEDRDDTNKVFNQTLSTDEKVILSNLMIVEWLTKEVNDILSLRNFLQDTDFKTYSQANNLKEKRELLTTMKEMVDKQIIQYSYNNFDWSKL